MYNHFDIRRPNAVISVLWYVFVQSMPFVDESANLMSTSGINNVEWLFVILAQL